MFLSKTPTYIAFGLFLLAMYSLFCIKDKVMLMKVELGEVKKQIKQEKDSIHVLKAEFTYLSSPVRLSKLNDNYLKLTNTSLKQLVADPLIKKDYAKTTRKFLTASNVSIKWRFKKGPKRYITRVAGKRR